MPRKRWIAFGLLGALFAGLLVYGIATGDALYVLKNAQNFCFT